MNIVAKKRFGQNFLKDESILIKIIQSMPNDDNAIVEIGPGLGDLTSKLLRQNSVRAFEVDRDLCPILEQKFKQEIKEKKFSLDCIDVLEYWENHESLEDRDYNLVANLPYYISTTIILKAFDDDRCKNIMVMTQLEVAKKFSANIGEKEFSSLGVLSNMVGSAKILFEVPSTSFDPVPKVTSAVLLITKKTGVNLSDTFKNFLKVSFSQPRKKLSKNLSSKFDKTLIQNIFKEENIEENTRPHQVSTEQYSRLYKKIAGE